MAIARCCKQKKTLEAKAQNLPYTYRLLGTVCARAESTTQDQANFTDIPGQGLYFSMYCMPFVILRETACMTMLWMTDHVCMPSDFEEQQLRGNGYALTTLAGTGEEMTGLGCFVLPPGLETLLLCIL